MGFLSHVSIPFPAGKENTVVSPALIICNGGKNNVWNINIGIESC